MLVDGVLQKNRRHSQDRQAVGDGKRIGRGRRLLKFELQNLADMPIEELVKVVQESHPVCKVALRADRSVRRLHTLTHDSMLGYLVIGPHEALQSLGDAVGSKHRVDVCRNMRRHLDGLLDLDLHLSGPIEDLYTPHIYIHIYTFVEL